jgi:hypothetical protein
MTDTERLSKINGYVDKLGIKEYASKKEFLDDFDKWSICKSREILWNLICFYWDISDVLNM